MGEVEPAIWHVEIAPGDSKPFRQYGLTVRPAGGVEVAGSPTVFVG